jgi:hypothetical protein
MTVTKLALSLLENLPDGGSSPPFTFIWLECVSVLNWCSHATSHFSLLTIPQGSLLVFLLIKHGSQGSKERNVLPKVGW